MALMTARPWKHPKTGAYHLRQRTPLDLVVRVKGQAVSLPVGETTVTVKVGAVVQVCLRTKDAAEARTRHAVADGALKRFWEAQRNGPSPLSQRQATALAGKLYRAVLAGLEEEGDEALNAVLMGEEALEIAQSEGPEALSAFLNEGLPPDRREAAAMIRDTKPVPRDALERAFGSAVDAILRQEGLIVTDASRHLLLREVRAAMSDAGKQEGMRLSGNFQPDAVAQRFPEWQRPATERTPERAPDDKLTVAELIERWAGYSADKKAANTIKRYRGSFRSLAAFIKDRDIRSITPDDLFAWAEHRRDAEGITPRAINKNDMVAVSSVFGWAASRHGKMLLTENPARGVHLEEPRRVAKRERTFRDEEIATILSAASAVKPDAQNPTFAAARRWCPWLAAYSGARIAELTHLERRDIRTEGGVPVMDLRVTKTGEPRTVPLHAHLIEQGFLAFVEDSGAGPLFYDPKRHGKASSTPPAEMRGHKVAKWVREAAKLDPDVDPNHGWRHTWKTRALGAGIEERLRDAMTGHRVRSVGRRYEAPSLAMLAHAMKNFPKYLT